MTEPDLKTKADTWLRDHCYDEILHEGCRIANVVNWCADFTAHILEEKRKQEQERLIRIAYYEGRRGEVIGLEADEHADATVNLLLGKKGD